MKQQVSSTTAIGVVVGVIALVAIGYFVWSRPKVGAPTPVADQQKLEQDYEKAYKERRPTTPDTDDSSASTADTTQQEYYKQQQQSQQGR
jgi:hypothetical protein